MSSSSLPADELTDDPSDNQEEDGDGDGDEDGDSSSAPAPATPTPTPTPTTVVVTVLPSTTSTASTAGASPQPTVTTVISTASSPDGGQTSQFSSPENGQTTGSSSSDNDQKTITGGTTWGLTTYVTSDSQGTSTVTTSNPLRSDVSIDTPSGLTTYTTTNDQGVSTATTSNTVRADGTSPSGRHGTGSDDLSRGAVAGIVIGVIAPLVLIIGALLWCFRLRLRRKFKRRKVDPTNWDDSTAASSMEGKKRGPPGNVDLYDEYTKTEGPAELQEDGRPFEAQGSSVEESRVAMPGSGISELAGRAELHNRPTEVAGEPLHELGTSRSTSGPPRSGERAELYEAFPPSLRPGYRVHELGASMPISHELEGGESATRRDLETTERQSLLSSERSPTEISPMDAEPSESGPSMSDLVSPVEITTHSIARKPAPGRRVPKG